MQFTNKKGEKLKNSNKKTREKSRNFRCFMSNDKMKKYVMSYRV